MAEQPDMYEGEATISEWNRKLRHRAARKLHRASWAAQENDDDDAIKDIRSAAALVLKMTEPDGEVLRLCAAMIAEIWTQDGVPTIGPALALLVPEGEVLTDVPRPF